MEVVLSEPNSWYLLKKGDTYFIDVHCEQSFMSFSLLIELNANEYREYHALGRTFLQYFAEKISYWSHEYQERNATGSLQAEAYEAIMRFRNEPPRPPDGFISLPE